MESVLIFVLGIVAGATGVWLFFRRQAATETPVHEDLSGEVLRLTSALSAAEAQLSMMRQQNERFGTEVPELTKNLATREAELALLREQFSNQKIEFEQLHERFKTEFENLATKILEEKSSKFTEQNKLNIKQILDPLGEKIKDFEQKVEQKYVKEAEGRSALAQQIKHLSDLNKQISEEASNLTKALKGSTKTQGDWGELRLELILEKAGLVKDIHYTTQSVFKDEDGSIRKPDFIIHLPDNKHVVVDSKVSLVAYENFYSTEDDGERNLHLKAHISSIREHVKQLSAKSYQSIYQINTPDYVLMYIPIEPAFNLAIQNDQDLYLDALGRNIVIVTTSTLLATLTTVASIWKQEDQKKHVLEIARQSGELYDKFVLFAEDLLAIGKRLNDAKSSYEGAMNKLTDGRGNLVRRVEEIKKLGAKASKSLPQALIDRANQETE